MRVCRDGIEFMDACRALYAGERQARGRDGLAKLFFQPPCHVVFDDGVFDAAGKIYGTTAGTLTHGSVFEIKP